MIVMNLIQKVSNCDETEERFNPDRTILSLEFVEKQAIIGICETPKKLILVVQNIQFHKQVLCPRRHLCVVF